MAEFIPAQANRSPRKQKNLKLSAESCDMLRRMAAHFDTTEADIVETCLMTYGPKILMNNPSEKRRKA